MSERYGACKLCKGKGCGICGDTGFGGGIDDLENPLRIESVLKKKIERTKEEIMDIAVNKMTKDKK